MSVLFAEALIKHSGDFGLIRFSARNFVSQCFPPMMK